MDNKPTLEKKAKSFMQNQAGRILDFNLDEFEGYKLEGTGRFDVNLDDLEGYRLKGTGCFYAVGRKPRFYKSLTEGILEPFMWDNLGVPLSVPVYRNIKLKKEFFVPGVVKDKRTNEVTKSGVKHPVTHYEFYELSDEEKEGITKMIHKEYTPKIIKELRAVAELYSHYIDTPLITTIRVGNLKVLFGEELYKGETKENFRKGVLQRLSVLKPSIDIHLK